MPRECTECSAPATRLMVGTDSRGVFTMPLCGHHGQVFERAGGMVVDMTPFTSTDPPPAPPASPDYED